MFLPAERNVIVIPIPKAVTMKERFLSQRQRYGPISLPQNFSDEEMARDWTLTELDLKELGRYRMVYRLYIAVQADLCGSLIWPVHRRS